MSLVGTCEIEREYFLAGLTVEQIARHSVDVESFSSRAAITDHTHALYVNSSDSINVIVRHADVKCQNVLTVAGSGDFAFIFLYRNCKSLCLVDLSPFALFLCELKLRAIEALTYDEYRALFYVPQIYSNDYRGPFVCRSVYRRLREQLTAQARAFFDVVTDEDNGKFWQICEPASGNSRILRFRTSYHPSGNLDRRHVLTDVNIYRCVQQSLRTTPCTLLLQDISALDDVFDYVYASNIGYLDCMQGDVVEKILGRGTTRVGLTTRSLESLSCVMDETGQLYPSFDSAPPGVPVANVFVNIVHQPRLGDACKKTEPLIPGAAVSLDGVPAEVIGVGIGEDFPVYLEARSTKTIRKCRGLHKTGCRR
jgi:hypothetical protein